MLTDKQYEWESDDDVQLNGWYATIHCWEVEEGMFPGANYWNGTSWDFKMPVFMWAGPFLSKSEAEEWAYEHDPEK